MTAPEKTDPARGWLAIDKLRLDDEVERLERMTDDEVLAEMGTDASQIPTAEKLLAKVRPTVPVTPMAAAKKARGVPRIVWLLAAAFIVLLIVTAKKDAIVALFRTPAPSPLPQPEPKPRAPSPQELANIVRTDAQKACAAGQWVECSAKLNEAEKLDPAGESLPAVGEMREAIAQGLLLNKELYAKPRR